MENLTPVYSNRGRFFPFYNSCQPNSYNGNSKTDKQTIRIYKGSSIELNVSFPFSLNGVTLSIVSASPQILTTAEIEYVDEFNAIIIISSEISNMLQTGDSNKFRLGVTFSDGTQKNYNNIWIKVE